MQNKRILTKEKNDEIKEFIFEECFSTNNLNWQETSKVLIEKYSKEELIEFFEGYNNPCSLDQCETWQEYISKCVFKRDDLYWENHWLNQD